jgi:Tfp pilus assembly PilM family ATPase
MKANRRFTYIAAVTDTGVKVIQCLCAKGSRPEIAAAATREWALGTVESDMVASFREALKALDYDRHPVLISLSRSMATCRFIRIPAVVPSEIEKISSLQASRYLPYPAQELVSSFDVVSVDPEGFSDINLTIVHKKNNEPLLKMLKELKVGRAAIVISSYALLNLYTALTPADPEAILLVDLDARQAEIAAVQGGKLLFSRCVKLNRASSEWQETLIDEVRKTQDTCLETVSAAVASRKIVLTRQPGGSELKDALEKRFSLPVSFLSPGAKIKISKESSQRVLEGEDSFAPILGLCLKEPEGSWNLLPQELKVEKHKSFQRSQGVRFLLFVLAMGATWSLGIVKHLDNKAAYLARLKAEMRKVAQQAKPLEDIEKRFGLMESKGMSKPNSLDILYEMYQVIPAQVTLVSLTYEAGKLALMRGQSTELNPVFLFVEQLGGSGVFKSFNVKLRYATKKKTASGELVDFEIECQRK